MGLEQSRLFLFERANGTAADASAESEERTLSVANLLEAVCSYENKGQLKQFLIEKCLLESHFADVMIDQLQTGNYSLLRYVTVMIPNCGYFAAAGNEDLNTALIILKSRLMPDGTVSLPPEDLLGLHESGMPTEKKDSLIIFLRSLGFAQNQAQLLVDRIWGDISPDIQNLWDMSLLTVLLNHQEELVAYAVENGETEAEINNTFVRLRTFLNDQSIAISELDTLQLHDKDFVEISVGLRKLGIAKIPARSIALWMVDRFEPPRDKQYIPHLHILGEFLLLGKKSWMSIPGIGEATAQRLEEVAEELRIIPIDSAYFSRVEAALAERDIARFRRENYIECLILDSKSSKSPDGAHYLLKALEICNGERINDLLYLNEDELSAKLAGMNHAQINIVLDALKAIESRITRTEAGLEYRGNTDFEIKLCEPLQMIRRPRTQLNFLFPQAKSVLTEAIELARSKVDSGELSLAELILLKYNFILDELKVDELANRSSIQMLRSLRDYIQAHALVSEPRVRELHKWLIFGGGVPASITSEIPKATIIREEYFSRVTALQVLARLRLSGMFAQHLADYMAVNELSLLGVLGDPVQYELLLNGYDRQLTSHEQEVAATFTQS